ncbi:hypothetical protein J6590_008498 [Homalodisca vitripennis]|nr:hypothetical protein J6590_008498 [Homalodisca vitripennis]
MYQVFTLQADWVSMLPYRPPRRHGDPEGKVTPGLPLPSPPFTSTPPSDSCLLGCGQSPNTFVRFSYRQQWTG